MNYEEFLIAKMPQAEVLGFEPETPAHPSLFPHQSDIARWACRGGRRAVFAAFGLGKTRTHLQVAKWIIEREPCKKYLIVAPLGVRQELAQAKLKHPPLKSAHEGYAVILEELDEVWVLTKMRRPNYEKMHAELVQVAAMAQRMAEEICQREMDKEE